MKAINILDSTFVETNFRDAADGFTFDDIDVAARLTEEAAKYLDEFLEDSKSNKTRSEIIDHLQRDAVNELRNGELFITIEGVPYYQADESDFVWYVRKEKFYV